MPIQLNLFQTRDKKDKHSNKQILNLLDAIIEIQKTQKEEKKIAFFDKFGWMERQ
jgi:hypothetical protein